MSMVFRFLKYSCFLFVPTFANWEWKNPTVTGASFKALVALNNGTLFVGGENGTLLRSNDAGNSWQPVNIDAHFSINAINFLNSDTGWAVGGYGTIFQTVDGGSTWSNKSRVSTLDLRSVFFLNSSHGWIVTVNSFEGGGSGPGGKVLRTRDGGNSWVELSQGLYTDSKKIFFLDTNTGWLAGSRLYKTTNGGGYWSDVAGLGITNLFFIDSLTGWYVANNGNVGRTNDGGLNWNESFLGESLEAIHFVNRSVGWITGVSSIGESIIHFTVNGGASWSFTASKNFGRMYAIGATDPNNVWMAGSQGAIIRSQNGGASWSRVTLDLTAQEPAPITFTQTFFVDSLFGWAVGNYRNILGLYSTYPFLIRTQNGGNTWDTLPLPPLSQNALKSVRFIDRQNGWISFDGTLGATGIYATSNSGQTWQVRNTTMKADALHFLDIDSGWATAKITPYSDLAGLWKTTDGGLNWIKKMQPVDSTQILFSSPSKKILWVCDGTRVYRSTDGGENWRNSVVETNGLTLGLHALDSMRAWICGTNARIWRTRDGGMNWTLKIGPTLSALTSIQFNDSLRGWAAGDYGVILHTSDGGENWLPQKSVGRNLITSLFFQSANKGWATGTGAMLLSTSDGGGSTPAPSTVSGYVLDFNSKPIPGAELKILSAAYNSSGNQYFTNTVSAQTSGTGYYSLQIPYGWSGYMAASKGAFSFTPDTLLFWGGNVRSNQVRWFQSNYCNVTIGGRIMVRYSSGSIVPGGGIRIITSDSISQTSANSSGYYSLTVPCGWSGMVMPENSNYYDFSPTGKAYSDIQAPDSLDFLATVNPVEIGTHSLDKMRSKLTLGLGSNRITAVIPSVGQAEILLYDFKGTTIFRKTIIVNQPGIHTLSLDGVQNSPVLYIGKLNLNQIELFRGLLTN